VPKIYLAWRCGVSTPPVTSSFEYLIHPMSSADCTLYCTALLEASDKQAAWRKVQLAFTSCDLVYSEVADSSRIMNYNDARQSGNVRIVPPREA